MVAMSLETVRGTVGGVDFAVRRARMTRLDQMASPAAPVDMNGQVIKNVGDPVNPADAATKDYVDAHAGAQILDELDDVETPSPQPNELLYYHQPSGLWKGTRVLDGGNF